MPDLPKDRLIAEISVWSADLLNLERDLGRIGPYADMLHIDVADARFTPDFLFFPDLVARLVEVSPCPVHVHLMVQADMVLRQALRFAETGARMVTIHAETGDAGLDALAALREAGCETGVALTLDTEVDRVLPYLPGISMLTLMGTRIGIKGAGLDPLALGRIREARAMLGDMGREDVLIAADGGIRETTVPDLLAAGAHSVVLGSLAFGAPDLKARFDWLRNLGAPA